MHPRVSVNTLSLDAGGPHAGDLRDRAARIAAIGAAAISPTAEEVAAFGVPEAARAIADAGLRVATLTHRAFGFATAREEADARARLDDTIRMAGAIGAGSVTLTTGGRGALDWAEAAARFARAIAPCAARAASAGVTLALEPTSHLYADVSIAHRLADTAALARAAGIGITLDLFACWHDSDIEAAILACGPSLVLVQVSDQVGGDRALPCRAAPGDGMVPLDRLIGLVERTGFAGFHDLEIIGPRLGPDRDAGLRRAGAWLGLLLDATGASAPQAR